MKDKQIAPASAEPRIFFVSPFLHIVSMTAFVFLRSSFEFGFLRPKSLFFAFSWALSLYAVYAWIDGAVWRQQRSLIAFGCLAALLYWIHLLNALIREWNETGEHDQCSGTSHIIRAMQRIGFMQSATLEKVIPLWIEPIYLLLIATGIWNFTAARWLSIYCFVAALCLWIKEALNQWYRIRQRGRQRDSHADAEDIVNAFIVGDHADKVLVASRKTRIKRTRQLDQT